jgi:hypothetical protein
MFGMFYSKIEKEVNREGNNLTQGIDSTLSDLEVPGKSISWAPQIIRKRLQGLTSLLRNHAFC